MDEPTLTHSSSQGLLVVVYILQVWAKVWWHVPILILSYRMFSLPFQKPLCFTYLAPASNPWQSTFWCTWLSWVMTTSPLFCPHHPILSLPTHGVTTHPWCHYPSSSFSPPCFSSRKRFLFLPHLKPHVERKDTVTEWYVFIGLQFTRDISFLLSNSMNRKCDG